MAQIINVGEQPKEVKPENGTHFTLAEMQGIVGGYIQTIWLPKKGMTLVINEEGELENLPVNEEATKVWLEEFPLDEFPHNNNGRIVGNALLTEEEYLEKDE